MAQLNSLKVAILVAEGFEQAELVEPKKALEEAGAHRLAREGPRSGVEAFRQG